jgi:carbon-monoxide dehydrogenase small subunit
MLKPVTMKINGRSTTILVEPRWSLAELLREHLHLTGTHIGCDTTQCGACTLHVNGVGVKSCTLLAVQADGAEIVTIEGIAKNKELHPMQAAFQDNHGLQCGYCTPGMIMSALDMVRREPELTDAIVRKNLLGNICRCTGYYNIVKAILAGAAAMRANGDRAEPGGEANVSV